MTAEQVELVAQYKGYEIENGRTIVSVDLASVDLPKELDRYLTRFAERDGRNPDHYQLRVIPHRGREFVHIKK